MSIKNLYNVYDEQKKKQIGEALTSAEVMKLTKAGKINPAEYERYGTRIRKRYTLALSPLTPIDETSHRNDLYIEWDKVCKAAQMLKEGKGKIVTEIVNGREVKYTVPIGG